MEKRKLSKSACEKYMACPFSFKAYYLDKIRPVNVGSALMFGSGIDAALNSLLLNPELDPLDEYRKAVAEYELGRIDYGRYDFDQELLTEPVVTKLLPQLLEVGYKGNDPLDLFQKLSMKDDLSENQIKALDLIYRAVFEVKAELMLQAYRRHVLPQIKKVYNVQKQSGPGFLDATVEWEGHGKVILDNKTSGRPYPEDAIDYSAQLAMYSAEENVPDVAFVVLIKEIEKNRRKVCTKCGHVGKGAHKTCDATVNGDRCNGAWDHTIDPEAKVQILHGKVTPEMMNVAAELQHEVQRAVDAEIFPCNVGQCNNQYGKPCAYRNLKWKGDMTGLEVVKSKGKKK